MVGYKRVIDECKDTRVESKNAGDLTVYLRQLKCLVCGSAVMRHKSLNMQFMNPFLCVIFNSLESYYANSTIVFVTVP